jgi:hypothetical protein
MYVAVASSIQLEQMPAPPRAARAAAFDEYTSTEHAASSSSTPAHRNGACAGVEEAEEESRESTSHNAVLHAVKSAA